MELLLSSMILLSCLISFLVLYSASNNLLRKLKNHPPGPFFILPIIGHIHLILKKPMHKQLYTLSKKYGPVYSLRLCSRTVLVVNTPKAAEDCLSKKNDVIFANRPNLLAGKYEGYDYTSMSWTPYGDHWRNLRRISSMELLSPQRMQTLSYIMLEDVRAFVRHLFDTCKENPVVELRTMMFEVLFNVTTKMIVGKRYYGENADDQGKEFKDIIEEMHRAVNISTMIDFIPWLPGSGKAEAIYKAIHEKRDMFLQNIIDGVRARGSDNQHSANDDKTMLQVLLSLHESDPEYYTDETIKGIMAVLLTGGSDSSVATMEWAMALLLNNPRVLKKAQAEMDIRVGHGRLINNKDFANLPYLIAIVKETLRLYPIVPFLMPHQSSEDASVGGFNVPQGTMLLINAWAIHNDPSVWEDPHMFKPERFMTEDGTKEEQFKFMPFGKGRRGCPAEPLAMGMIVLALGALLQCFHWDRLSDEMEDMGEDTGISLTKTRPLRAKCWPRPNMMNLLSRSKHGEW